MLGIIYLLLCFLTGYGIIELLFKNFGSTAHKTFSGKDTDLSSAFILLPAYFITGVLVMTWPLYILAYLFRTEQNALSIANAIVMLSASVFVVVSVFIVIFRKRKYSLKGEGARVSAAEIVMIALVSLLSCFLMFQSLGQVDGKLKIGLSVFSDFSTHLSMMRSFSHMGNFPTSYTFFGGEDVKYHFMFQFLCGNLEYLGLRMDLALNIPSALSMIFTYFMLYTLTVKICRKKTIGFVTLVLYSFRSSNALFEYILTLPKNEVWETLANNDICEFIGSTNHEDWGLWNLNVYCNQRHFSFSLSILLLVIILVLPTVYESSARLRLCLKEYVAENGSKLKYFFKNLLFKSEGWKIKDLKTCIFAGTVLGLSGFFNGAVLIGTVIVLFFLAIGSDRRLEYVILAAIAGVLSLIQSKCFITSSLFTPSYRYGFLSEPDNFFGAVDFIRKMMGILPLVLLIQFAKVRNLHKFIMACFSMPIIFAFTVSLTPDIAVNHKYIMISIMLLDVYAAAFLVGLFEKKDICYGILGVLTAICLTFTGFFEFIIVARKNVDERAIQYAYEDEITEWIWENADSDDIFLTANYYLMYGGRANSVILSGAQMYNGWEYFSWSAGYETSKRDEIEIKIYSSRNSRDLYKLVDEAGIDYIVIDRVNRDSDMYDINEKVFDYSFEKVFSTGSGEDMFSIYDVSKKINEAALQ